MRVIIASRNKRKIDIIRKERGMPLFENALTIPEAIAEGIMNPIDDQFPEPEKYIDMGYHVKMAWEKCNIVRQSLITDDDIGIIASQTGFEVASLNYEPGPNSAKMIEQHGDDVVDIIMKKIENDFNRCARMGTFSCFQFITTSGETSFMSSIKETYGYIPSKIADVPADFPYDRMLYCERFYKLYCALTDEELFLATFHDMFMQIKTYGIYRGLFV